MAALVGDIRKTLIAIVYAGCSMSLRAGTVTPPDEYSKYVGQSDRISSFKDFGDQVNLRDGSFQFKVTDVELLGVGPPIRLIRTYRPNSLGQDFRETSGTNFGGWEVEIPRIKTVVSMTSGGVSQYSPVGWQVAGNTTAAKNARCTSISPPGRVNFPYDRARGWDAYEWWNGYHLINPDGGDQLLMIRSDATVRPELKLMTADNWLVGCLASTKSGEPGEAFYAFAPDGTKYWFDYLVYTPLDELQKPLWSNQLLMGGNFSGSAYGVIDPSVGLSEAHGVIKGPSPSIIGDFDYLSRATGTMYVTRVEDRFGNWVTYHYTSGRLDSIDASDGRHLGLSYGAPGAATVTAGSGASARVWSYTFNSVNPSVTQQLTVTLPDGAKWIYSLPSLPASALNAGPDPVAGCSVYPNDYDMFVDGSVTAPSGATLTLRVNRKRFARSYVPKECWGGEVGAPDTGYAKYPKEWYAFALVSRTVSGPGVTTATWSYSYAPPMSSWVQDCQLPNVCLSTTWTDVTHPDGVRQRSVFSNKYDESENKLIREEIYSTSGQLLRSIEYAYATVSDWGNNPYPWLARIGNDMLTRVNPRTSGQWAPVRQKQIIEQGRTFNWQVPFACGAGGTASCFDVLARPTKVVRTSSP